MLVHGTPTWSYVWRKVAPALAETFTVYVFDLPGYGDSPAPNSEKISIRTHTTTFLELLDYWGLRTPAVVGHDIGGATVLRAQLLHGRDFRQIALVDAVVLAPWITPTTQHIQAHIDVYRTMPSHIFEQITAAHLGTAVHRALDHETFSAYHRQWSGARGQAAYLQKVAHFDEDDTRELEPLLGRVAAPVRIIWGEEDRWLDVALAERLRDAIPGSDLMLIRDAGHFVMEDAPAEVAQALIDFLAAS